MNFTDSINIGVLITCHNRREKTLKCLSSLFSCNVSEGFQLDVFLVDDGSTDGTGEAVKTDFPDINVIQGNGKLFWNQGMRLAWQTAAAEKDYDFYIWLNDDTILDSNALEHLLVCYKEGKRQSKTEVLVISACRTSFKKNIFSYGGRTEDGPVVPNGELQSCKFINGNAVLVPRKIFGQIGNFSSDYTHAMGDFDYGLRAIQNGFKCFTTKAYVATCPPNERIPGWCNPKVPLLKRWKLLHSPQGLNIKEYNAFRKKFWGRKWRSFAFKAYAKMLSPKLYKKFLQYR